MAVAYPDSAPARDQWILSRRPARHEVDASRPYAVVTEQERDATGEVVSVLTVFLTNRECPWRCLMCDLWKNTLDSRVPDGAIPAQIDYALERLPPARHIKLYNSGSFFDAGAIPRKDYPAIAQRLRGFERVIVECHPSLVGPATLEFQELLSGQLEVAMGLETANPEVLARLNKRMTREQFAAASAFLRQHEIDLRVFILIKPPFLNETEALHWAAESVRFAFDCGASVVSLIPTRAGNGAMEALMEEGLFSPPTLSLIEQATRGALAMKRGRTLVDLWDLKQFAECEHCFEKRRAALERMNLTQVIEPSVECAHCASASF